MEVMMAEGTGLVALLIARKASIFGESFMLILDLFSDTTTLMDQVITSVLVTTKIVLWWAGMV